MFRPLNCVDGIDVPRNEIRQGKMLQRIYISVFLASLFLCLLTVYGTIHGVSRHPAAVSSQLQTKYSPDRTLESLETLHLGDANFFPAITNILNKGIKHYWVPPGKIDKNTEFGWSENWILASLTKFEEASNKFLGKSNEKFSHMERYHLADILEKGVGYCSQISIALQAALAEKNINSDIVSLDGHVIVQTHFNKQSWLLDSNFNVAMPLSLSEVEKNPELVTDFYLTVGLPKEAITALVNKYGREGNVIGYSPRSRLFVLTTAWLKYIIPIILIVVSGYGYFRNRKITPE